MELSSEGRKGEHSYENDWFRTSGVDDQEDHDYQDEEEHHNCADLSHVVGLQQFAQFGLHEVHLLHGVVHVAIQFLDQVSLLRQLRVYLLALQFQSLRDVVDFVEVLVLLLKLFLVVLRHLFLNIISSAN